MQSRDLKKLIIFYSFEGNTKFIAEGIKDIAGADLLELKPKKDVNTKGFMKYVWGGTQVIMGKKPELESFDKNPDNYDILFIGTPIWASRYAPAINSFIHKESIKGKKIVLFCCHAGGGNGKAFSTLKEQLKDNDVIGSIEFQNPLKNGKDEAAARLEKWVKEIL